MVALAAVLLITLCLPVVRPFTLSLAPTYQCHPLTLSWTVQNAVPPFTLFAVPINSSVGESFVRIPNDTWDASRAGGRVTVPELPWPADTQYLAFMNDANGFGTGSTSLPMTIGASNNTDCLRPPPPSRPPTNLFSFQDIPRQCETFSVGWNAPDLPHANLSVRGLVPGGTAFELLPNGTSSIEWIVNLPHGSRFMLLLTDLDDRADPVTASPLFTVGGDASKTNCLLPEDPFPTANAVSAVSEDSRTQSKILGSLWTNHDRQVVVAKRTLSSSNVALIAGLTIGVVAGILLGVLLWYFFRVRRRQALVFSVQPAPQAPPWSSRPRSQTVPSDELQPQSTHQSQTRKSRSARPRPLRSPSHTPPKAGPSGEPIPTPELDLSPLSAVDAPDQFGSPSSPVVPSPSPRTPTFPTAVHHTNIAAAIPAFLSSSSSPSGGSGTP